MAIAGFYHPSACGWQFYAVGDNSKTAAGREVGH